MYNTVTSFFSESKGRLEYIDALRVFTMLMVVYSHLVGFVLHL